MWFFCRRVPKRTLKSCDVLNNEEEEEEEEEMEKW